MIKGVGHRSYKNPQYLQFRGIQLLRKSMEGSYKITIGEDRERCLFNSAPESKIAISLSAQSDWDHGKCKVLQSFLSNLPFSV